MHELLDVLRRPDNSKDWRYDGTLDNFFWVDFCLKTTLGKFEFLIQGGMNSILKCTVLVRILSSDVMEAALQMETGRETMELVAMPRSTIH